MDALITMRSLKLCSGVTMAKKSSSAYILFVALYSYDYVLLLKSIIILTICSSGKISR